MLTGTAEAGTTVTLMDGTTTLATTVATSAGAYSFSRSGVTPGAHAFSAFATDKAGNVGVRSAATAVTVDTTAPAAPAKPVLDAARDTGASSSDGITRSPTLVLTGTAEAGATVTLYEGSTSRGTAVAAANGAYSIGLSAVAEGAHSYVARAVDKAGNTSTASPSSAITVDTTAPDVAITSPGGSTTNRNQIIAGTGEAGTTLELKRNGASLGTTMIAANGTWSRAVTLAEGTNSFSATDTDVAGNVGTSGTVAYTYQPPGNGRQMAIAMPAGSTAQAQSPVSESASLARALFDATFSPASTMAALTHEAAVPHPVLAASS